MTPPMTHLVRSTGRPGRRNLRLGAAVLLGVLTAGTLTGCSPSGNAAQTWLDRNPIIESTTLTLTGCEAMCDPLVKGGITDSATESEVRQLMLDTTAYLAASTSKDLSMSLGYQKLSIVIGTDAQKAKEDADLAVAALNDDRIASALIGSQTLYLSASRADLTAVYTQYGPDSRITVMDAANEDFGDTQVDNHDGQTCGSSASLLTAFDALIADPVVTAVDLQMCTSLTVTIGAPAGREAMIAQLQPLASDPALAGVTFEILGDDHARFDVTAETAALAPFLAVLAATAGVESYESNDNTVTVKVADPAQLRPVALAIDAAPKPAAVLVIVATPAGSVYLNGDGSTAAQVALIETLVTLDGRVHGYSSPGALKVTAAPYSAALGHQVVDAVLASELTRSAAVTIEVPGAGTDMVFTLEVAAGGKQFTTTRSDGTADADEAIADLNAYWSTGQPAAAP